MKNENIQEFCRKEVLEFARVMESVLRKNDFKKTWKDCGWTYLLSRLKEELSELEQCEAGDIEQETADVANFAMMIWDIYGRKKT